MKNKILFLILFIGITSNAQKNIYESKNFDDLSQEHNVLAVLPFLTNLDLKGGGTKKEL